MGKKMTAASVKKKLEALEKEELIELILRLYRKSSAVSTAFNLELGDESVLDEELEKAIESVKKQFFPKRGFGKLDLAQAKKDIKAFDALCSDPKRRVDLKLSFVEYAAEFTLEYGGINERFYTTAEDVFEAAVTELGRTKNTELIRSFLPRMDAIVEQTSGIGWGFSENLYDILLELEEWRTPEEQEARCQRMF